MTTEQKNLWIGIGIGFAAGGVICGVTASTLTKKSEQKKYEERIRKERRIAFMDGKDAGYSDGYQDGVDESIKGGSDAVKAAYEKGVDDATLEAQKWMEEHLIQVDSNDPKVIQEAIEKASKIANESAPENEKGNISQKEDEKRLSEEDYAEHNGRETLPAEKKSVEKAENEVEQIFKTKGFSGRRYMIQHAASGKTLEYPIELFCDSNGFLSPSQMRINIRDYEKDPNKLKIIWESMGWGTYVEDPDEIPDIETINNYDVSIDDVNHLMDEAKDDPEPEERTLEFERYLDKVEIYKNNPKLGIKYITYDEYSEESHLDHIRLDYYPGDNVFLQPDSDDRKLEDPVTDLGVSNGQILFDENPYKDRDPDLVCIENFGQHFVAEITRYKGNSTGIMDGSAYLNGETGIVGGTPGV